MDGMGYNIKYIWYKLLSYNVVSRIKIAILLFYIIWIFSISQIQNTHPFEKPNGLTQYSQTKILQICNYLQVAVNRELGVVFPWCATRHFPTIVTMTAYQSFLASFWIANHVATPKPIYMNFVSDTVLASAAILQPGSRW